VAGVGEITEAMIAQRAYKISQGPDAGSSEENWQRAEEELWAELGAHGGSPDRQRQAGEESQKQGT
jgi:hypothetical protein